MNERDKIVRLRNMMNKLDSSDKDTVFNFVESYCDIRHSGTQQALEEIKAMITAMEKQMNSQFCGFKESIESIKKELGMNGYGNHD